MFRETDKPIVKSQREIMVVLDTLASMPAFGNPEQAIGDYLERIRLTHINNELRPIDSSVFGAIGCCAYQLLRATDADWESRSFCDLLLTKHVRYGAHPLRVWGALGVIIRLYSKYERYRNIKANPALSTVDEGALDTLNDILGYCVLGYLMVK